MSNQFVFWIWDPDYVNHKKDIKNTIKENYDKISSDGMSFYAAEEFEFFQPLDLDVVPYHLNNYIIFGNLTTTEFQSKFNNKFKIIHWPNYFLFKSYNYTDTSKNIKHLNKLYINLNNYPKDHRCMFIDSLSMHKLLDEGYNSWLRPRENYKWKHWIQKKLTIEKHVNQWNLPKQWYRALVNIVNESSSNVIFFTEKTWQPILTKKPFMINGAKNSHQILKEWGFVLYDEIIDYSFDMYEGQERVNKIIDNLKILSKQDYNLAYNLVKEKTEYNKLHALRIIKEKMYVPQEVFNYLPYEEAIKLAMEKCND